MIGERQIAGRTALTIGTDDGEGIEVAFVPTAGMVGSSLRHRGAELLGQRGGLRTYIAERSTMGIPLLHPWANRVSKTRFRVAEREVDLRLAHPLPAVDSNGLPIHGLLAAASGWRVDEHRATDDGGEVRASYDFGADEGRMAGFPFPHTVRVVANVGGSTLTVETTIVASTEAPVPISFGYHPYLRLPDVDRSDWQIEVPVREKLNLDDRGLPDGSREAAAVESGPLGARHFDGEYRAPADGAPFVLTGGGRRIELSIGQGYRFAQLYAPEDDDVIAYEPMTAPTDALVTGGADLRLLEPGGSFEARFSIAVDAG